MKTKTNNKKRLIPILIIIISISLSITLTQLWKIYQNKKLKSFINLDNLGDICQLDKVCNNLVGIDCNAAGDGPYFYVKKETGKIISKCGGYCMSGKCKNCPPKEWTCTP